MSEQILDHHLSAVNEGDIEAILEDYTDESKIINSRGIITGLDNIRDLFTTFTRDIIPTGAKFELTNKTVDSNVAYIIWNAESAAYKIPFATDTFLFENGKIKVQTVALILEPKK
ncbi:MAG: nuclear transport factor 2 family protein [Deltaproteobacteria bacterium]